MNFTDSHHPRTHTLLWQAYGLLSVPPEYEIKDPAFIHSSSNYKGSEIAQSERNDSNLGCVGERRRTPDWAHVTFTAQPSVDKWRDRENQVKEEAFRMKDTRNKIIFWLVRQVNEDGEQRGVVR